MLSGEYLQAYHLFSHSRQALYDQLSINVSSSLGYVFLFLLLSQRGSITVALVTTTRKVFTVLLTMHRTSIKLEGIRGLGIAIIIAGVLVEAGQSIIGKKPKPDAVDEKKKTK